MRLSNMTSFVIGLASNTDDAEFQMEQAVQSLQTIFKKASVSSFYQSASISGDGSTYTNAVMAGLTEMSHNELSEKLKKLELKQGRDEQSRREKRVPLDLDLVIWDGRIERQNDFEQPYFNRGYRELLADGAFQYQL